MSVITDLWNYTLTTSSTPWRRVGGTASIGGGSLLLGNSALVRRTKPSSSFTIECSVVFDGVGGSIAPNQSGGATQGPGALLFSGTIYLGRLNYASTTPPLASIGGLQQAIPVVGSNYTLACKWFFKTTANQMAAVFVYNGIAYCADFTAFEAASAINFYSAGLSQVAAVGSLTITDGMTDAQVAALFPKIGVGAPATHAPTAVGTGTRVPAPPYGAGAASVRVPVANGVGQQIPSGYERLFYSTTAKPSHARIIRGYRSPQSAQYFHEILKERVA